MYHPEVIEQNLDLAKKQGLKYKRRSVAESRGIAEELERDWDLKYKDPKIRPVSVQNFIESEMLISRYDFRYWAERYASIEIDGVEGGGVRPPVFWASQERTLELIAEREIEVERQFKKHGYSEGILVCWHKCRQEGATALGRMLCCHRTMNWKNIRSIAASTNEDKRMILYNRDQVIWRNLPQFMRLTRIAPDNINEITTFGNASRIVYTDGAKASGIGTGDQFDVSHMTEVALWKYPMKLKFDFIPTIPQSRWTFSGWESTAEGRGNFWHDFSENIRFRKEGFEHWIYSFTPCYIEPKKYRRIPPEDWTPDPITVEYAELVERTSPMYCGKVVRPSKEHLYWWHTEREQNARDGTMNIFFTNYCATPEQSFQHYTGQAVPWNTLEWMETTSRKGMPYEVRMAA